MRFVKGDKGCRKNVKMHPKCDDLVKMTSENVKAHPKCGDLVKITPKNGALAPEGDN